MGAYVVITVGPGKAREVARAVAAIPGVKMSNACWGTDVFVVVEVADQKDLNKLIMAKCPHQGRGSHRSPIRATIAFGPSPL